MKHSLDVTFTRIGWPYRQTDEWMNGRMYRQHENIMPSALAIAGREAENPGAQNKHHSLPVYCSFITTSGQYIWVVTKRMRWQTKGEEFSEAGQP